MHCKTCDYPLWNTTARICPECGTPFSLHEYKFRQGAVRFCCPHCRQDYYGTSPAGHLEPESFNCIRCSRPISMEQMAVLPVEGVSVHMQDSGHNPWLAEPGGVFGRWWRTVRAGFARPSDVAMGTPPTASTGSALAYALISTGIIALAGLIPTMAITALFGGLMMRAGGGGPGGPGGAGVGVLMGSFVVQQISYFVGTLLYLLLWAGIAHGVLRMTGPIRGGFSTTLGAICYSSGCYLISIIPCIGMIGGLYWIIVSGIMLAAAQRISGARAAIATIAAHIVPGVVCISLFITFGGFSAWMGAGGPGFGAAAPVRPLDPTSRATRIQSAALTYYNQKGTLPDHPGRLLAALLVYPDDFAANPMNDTVSGITLNDLTLAAEPQADRAIRDELSQGRTDIGDVLFGPLGDDPGAVPLDDTTQTLWLFIVTPDLGGPLTQPIIVATPAGLMTARPEQFERLRAAQNTIRAGLGLPPFPDPTTVPRP